MAIGAWISAASAAWSMALAAPAPESYIERVAALTTRCGDDLPAMTGPAEEAAARLAAGGRFWAAGQPSMVSELCGRAGGVMMIRGLGHAIPGSGDVVLYTPEQDVATPENLKSTQALIVVFGSADAGFPGIRFDDRADEFGVSPTLANAVPAWLFTGETIAALTRLGKMPVIYESIGTYGGNARIQQFKNGEIAFHDDLHVPPADAGTVGKEFATRVVTMLRRVQAEEGADLLRAGQWAREARMQGKRLFMYSMGHLFPDEIEKTAIGQAFRSAVWNAGFRAHPEPDDAYMPGDLAVHIGYQHPPDVLLRRARPAGARVVYVALRSDRDFVADPGVLWIDPMWDWPDACVSLAGYDVPLLAASGIVNGAIAWEIYRCGQAE